MVKKVVVDINKLVFSDDTLNLERRVDFLPTLNQVEAGLYSNYEKSTIVDDILRSLASQRGFFEGPETLHRRRISDDYVYLTEGSEREVGRIPLSDVSPTTVVKYLRLSPIGEEKNDLISSMLISTLPADCLVRPWREHTLRGGYVFRGIEVGLNVDYKLIINF